MRESVAARSEDRMSTKLPAKRNRISPELSEVLHMLSSLEDQFTKNSSTQ